jgi:hypothetical protein
MNLLCYEKKLRRRKDYMLSIIKGTALSGTVIIGFAIGLVLMIAKIVAMFWISDLFYDWGVWPVGALIRVVAWLEILAVVGGTLFVVIGLIGAGIGAVMGWLKHKPA